MIGIPGARISGQEEAGAVLVLYGRSNGLSSVDDLWSQDAQGIKGVSEADDHFGKAIAIGVPGETVNGQICAGAVKVIYGDQGAGLGTRANQLWTQNPRG